MPNYDWGPGAGQGGNWRSPNKPVQPNKVELMLSPYLAAALEKTKYDYQKRQEAEMEQRRMDAEMARSMATSASYAQTQELQNKGALDVARENAASAASIQASKNQTDLEIEAKKVKQKHWYDLLADAYAREQGGEVGAVRKVYEDMDPSTQEEFGASNIMAGYAKQDKQKKELLNLDIDDEATGKPMMTREEYREALRKSGIPQNDVDELVKKYQKKYPNENEGPGFLSDFAGLLSGTEAKPGSPASLFNQKTSWLYPRGPISMPFVDPRTMFPGNLANPIAASLGLTGTELGMRAGKAASPVISKIGSWWQGQQPQNALPAINPDLLQQR